MPIKYFKKRKINNKSINVTAEDLKYIKSAAELLCGISDSISMIFGTDNQIVKDIDNVENLISNKINQLLDN